MKNNNSIKRVAASALSILTVAGMMPANVGGFLTGGNAIVAYADNGNAGVISGNNETDTQAPVKINQKVSLAGVKNLITGAKFDNKEYKQADIKAAKDLITEEVTESFTVTSFINLDFSATAKVDATKYKYFEAANVEDSGSGVDPQQNQPAGWYEIDEKGNKGDSADEAEIIKKTLNIEDVSDYQLANDGTITEDITLTPSSGDYRTGFTYTVPAAEGLTINMKPAMGYNIAAEVNVNLEKANLKKMTVTPMDGDVEEYTSFGRNKIYAYEAKFGDVITLESTSLLTIDYAQGNIDYNVEGNYPVNYNKDTDTYTYKFRVFDSNVDVNTAKATVNVPVDATLKLGDTLLTKKESGDNADVYEVTAGWVYTVSKTGVPKEMSMNISSSAVDVQSSLVKEKDNAGLETGKKTYTTVFRALYEDVDVTIGDHTHQRKYTVDGNKVYVECTAPEEDLAKAVAAEVTLDFGYIDTENNNNFKSTKTDKGEFIFDDKSAVEVNISVKDFDTSNVFEGYVVSNKAEETTYLEKAPVIQYYAATDTEFKTPVNGPIKNAGSYVAVVTFTTQNKNGTPDTGDNSTVQVKIPFTISPKSVTDSRIRFFAKINDTDEQLTEYQINEKTGTYQIYNDGEAKTITPIITLDGEKIKNFIDYNAENHPNSEYYATGTTSAKYEGVNIINITSNDPNNNTGEGDFTVKWEIVQKPVVNIGYAKPSYTGEEDDVLAAIKKASYTNTDKYTLKFADGFNAALGQIDSDSDRYDNYSYNDAPATKADFDAASSEVPINAGNYTVIVDYIDNQEHVYKMAPLTIKPMQIKVRAEGYKTELNYGEKQSEATTIIVDENEKNITKQFVQQNFKLKLGNGEYYNPDKKYAVGTYTIEVEGINQLGSGNMNYVAANDWTGEVGRFEVKPAVISKDFTSFVVPTIKADKFYYTLTAEDVADAYNEFSKNTPSAIQPKDVEIVGGTVTAKNVTNRINTVKVEFKDNFRTEDGKYVELSWAIGSAKTVELGSFEPKYNEKLKACTVEATVNKLDTKAAVKEWGLVYDNKGLINLDRANFTSDAAYKEAIANALKEGFNTSSYKFKKNKASDNNNDKLTVIMANSFVDREVYAMAYVIYEDGTVVFDEANASSANYFNLVFDGLKIKQTDSYTHENGTSKMVKLSVQREEAKGYEVTGFGYIYNNKGNLTDDGADSWVTLDSTDKNMKRYDAKAGEETEIIANIANSKYASDVKVYAKAFVIVKDKNGTEKTFLTKIDKNTGEGIFQYDPEDDKPANTNQG